MKFAEKCKKAEERKIANFKMKSEEFSNAE